MNIIQKVQNAYETDGIKELVRKAAYKIVYSFNNKRTINYVKKSPLKYGLNKKTRKRKIIISLTSFPARFPKIGLCLKSLLCQSIKPDKIIVFFSSDTLPDDLTDEMKNLKKYGIEYIFDNEHNIKSHGKYFYAMKKYPDHVIITADDDVIYPRDWLISLLNAHKKFPKCVCARRVHLINFDINGSLKPYNHWADQCRNVQKPSHQLIATGVGGVLYPPHCLPQETFEIDKILELALNADDIWLKCMEIMNNTKVVWVKNWEVLPAETAKESAFALSAMNVDQNFNDIILDRIITAYKIDINAFRDE